MEGTNLNKCLQELVGHKIEHVVFGDCEVVEVISLEEGKFLGKILNDNVMKTLIFSKNYYKNIDDFESVELPTYQRRQKREYKQVDPTKFRNHPFVKAIDWKIAKERQKIFDHDILEDEIDDDEE